MALKVEKEIVKNLKCMKCGKMVESFAFPSEEETICLDCIDECMEDAARFNQKYYPDDKEE